MTNPARIASSRDRRYQGIELWQFLVTTGYRRALECSRHAPPAETEALRLARLFRP